MARSNVSGWNIKILGDSTHFLKALAGVDRGFAGFFRRLKGWAAVFGGVGAFFTFKHSIDEMTEFEDRLLKSTSILENIDERISNRFREMAISISQETKFMAKEVAEGFYFLASSGLNVEQVLKTMPEVAHFAQAGLIDIRHATELLVDAQSAMGLRSQDAQQNLKNLVRISNALTTASIISNATIEQLGSSLENKVAATARLAKRPLEEILAGLTVFADQGIKGRVAGNRLNIVLRELQSKAIINAEAFRKMNVQVYDLQGNLRPLADIIEDFEAVFSIGSTRRGRARFLNLGLTREATDSLLQLVGSSAKIRANIEKLLNPFASARDIAARNILPFRMELHYLYAEFQKLQFSLRHLLPFFTNVIKGLKAFFKAINQAVGNSRNFQDLLLRVKDILKPIVEDFFAFMYLSLRIMIARLVQYVAKLLSTGFVDKSFLSNAFTSMSEGARVDAENQIKNIQFLFSDLYDVMERMGNRGNTPLARTANYLWDIGDAISGIWKSQKNAAWMSPEMEKFLDDIRSVYDIDLNDPKLDRFLVKSIGVEEGVYENIFKRGLSDFKHAVDKAKPIANELGTEIAHGMKRGADQVVNFYRGVFKNSTIGFLADRFTDIFNIVDFTDEIENLRKGIKEYEKINRETKLNEALRTATTGFREQTLEYDDFKSLVLDSVMDYARDIQETFKQTPFVRGRLLARGTQEEFQARLDNPVETLIDETQEGNQLLRRVATILEKFQQKFNDFPAQPFEIGTVEIDAK